MGPPQPNCTLCDLHAQAPSIPRHVGIPAHLHSTAPTGAVVIYMGRNPGFNEDAAAENFVGRSGSLLKSVYIDGINASTLATIYLMNACRCYTIDNNPPRARHYKACLPYSGLDLYSILPHFPGPRILVLLGGDACAHAHRYLFNIKGMTLNRAFAQQGIPRLVGEYTVQVFATYHPSYVLRTPNAIHAVHNHNTLILDCLLGTSAVPSRPDFHPPTFPSDWTPPHD